MGTVAPTSAVSLEYRSDYRSFARLVEVVNYLLTQSLRRAEGRYRWYELSLLHQSGGERGVCSVIPHGSTPLQETRLTYIMTGPFSLS